MHEHMHTHMCMCTWHVCMHMHTTCVHAPRAGASSNVDVLSLTATPIPRTFYMCATGIRDMSLLATPPTGRLKVSRALSAPPPHRPPPTSPPS